MKIRHRIALTFALAAAGAVPLMGASSALTPDGTRYSVETTGKPELVIARAAGDTRATMTVPTTDDAATESEAQLAYDGATGALYVVWTRQSEGANDVRLAALEVDGKWSVPQVVATGTGERLGLQLVLTHATERETTATLLHLAWWTIGEPKAEAQYALVGIEDGAIVSTTVKSLDDLAALSGDSKTAGHENTGVAAHPPLAMTRTGDGVDVVFGAVDSTAVTRLSVDPRKIEGTVRAWTPVGRRGHRTPRANLVSADENPVRAFISRNGRVVLYAPGARFSFVVLENDEWSPVRSLRVDEQMTAEALVEDLRRTVEEIEMLAVPEADH